MTTVFLSLNGKTAASRLSFEPGDLNGVIFQKRPVINRPRTAEGGMELVAGAERLFRMLRFLKVILVLVVLIASAVIGFAYLGDLSPQQQDVSQPVTLDAE
jgi:hypothetical protein